MKNEIILYRPDEIAEHIEVRIDEETVWLNRQQISSLFNKDIKTIGKHINNVFSEGELVREVVVAKFATTTQHGAIKGKTQTKKVEYYNLDVIISVGYRVKSKQGTQFRIWATNVLRDYLLKGYAKSHDRFLIIDEKEIYHLGASLKDLGKKLFAFSKLEKHSVGSMMNEIRELI